MQLLFVFLITSDQLAIRKLFNPVTERMPLVELVVPPAFVNISQNLIIQHDRPSLVVRAREELDHLPPDLVLTHVLDNIANLMTYRENAIFEIGIFDVAPTIDIQNINRLLQMLIGPKYKPLSLSQPETGCPQNSLHHTYPCVQLSLFSQLFIGLRIPRMACSQPITSKLLIFSIIILLFYIHAKFLIKVFGMVNISCMITFI